MPPLALLTPVSRAEARAQGRALYFTGRACLRGHVAPRKVGDKKCVECVRERDRERYARNRASRLAWQKAYYEAHKPERQAYAVEYRKANRARLSERHSRWYAVNRDGQREKMGYPPLGVESGAGEGQ